MLKAKIVEYMSIYNKKIICRSMTVTAEIQVAKFGNYQTCLITSNEKRKLHKIEHLQFRMK